MTFKDRIDAGRKLAATLVPYQDKSPGAVVDGATAIVVKNEDIIILIGITDSEFKAVCGHELKEIGRQGVRISAAGASQSCAPHRDCRRRRHSNRRHDALGPVLLSGFPPGF